MHDIVTLIAEDLIVLLGIIFIAVWLKLGKRQRKELIALTLISAVLAILLSKLGSYLFYNPRPFIVGHFQPYFAHGTDNGFPSDHTLLSSLLAILAWRYDKRVGLLMFLLAVLIGLARVIAGVHHLIDIIGAIAASAAAVYLASLVVHDSRTEKPTREIKK